MARRHDEKCARGADNGYTIIGNFDKFRQEEDRDESHGRGYIALMIEDFGGEATGMRATADTNYVIVGQPPGGRAEREHYDLQLKEADTLELPPVSVDEPMRQIGGREANIKSPYKTKDDDEADFGSMEEDYGDAVA